MHTSCLRWSCCLHTCITYTGGAPIGPATHAFWRACMFPGNACFLAVVHACGPKANLLTSSCAARTPLPAVCCVQVALNTPAAAAAFPCSRAFDAATSAKLGLLSQCTSSGSVLTILLNGKVNLHPGQDILTLEDGQTALVGALGTPPPLFGGSSPPVASCAPLCPVPVASIQVCVCTCCRCLAE